MKRIFTTLSQKWPEYLLEVLVITVGILGAFALNNWNENRKTENEEYQTLISLKTDFEDRLRELNEIQAGREKIIKAIDEIFEQVNQQSISRPTSEIDSLLAYLNIQWTFNDQFSSLEMLFNTGKINELSNPYLRSQLINWPTLVEELLEEQRQYVRNVDVLMSVLSKHVNINYLLQYVNLPNKNFGTQLKRGVFPSNHLDLITDSQFVSELTEQRIYLVLNVADGRKLIDTAQVIISLLEQETTK